MAEIRLTAAAEQHLQEIWSYTEGRWGEEQADEYLRNIHSAISQLARTPELGMRRPDISPEYRFLPVGRHAIFYLVESDEIHIIGVLHARMDVQARLGS